MTDGKYRAGDLVPQLDFEGLVNVVAPNPVTNAEFTRVLGRVLHRPTMLPMPASSGTSTIRLNGRFLWVKARRNNFV